MIFFSKTNILEGKNDKRPMSLVKIYHMHSLKQLIRALTICTLIDLILTNSSEVISQSWVIDIGLSDHKLIFCTRKNKNSNLINIIQVKQETIKTIRQNNIVKN